MHMLIPSIGKSIETESIRVVAHGWEGGGKGGRGGGGWNGVIANE